MLGVWNLSLEPYIIGVIKGDAGSLDYSYMRAAFLEAQTAPQATPAL